MSIANFLSGTKTLDRKKSDYNGELTVVRDIAWGTYIKAGGLPQSGGLARKIWEKPLKKITNYQLLISNILILGFGGGGVVEIMRKNWPKAKITGVDIDPVIVDLGKKYIGWDEKGVNVLIKDAWEFVNKSYELHKYNLILVDTYNGSTFPAKFAKTEFVRKLKKILDREGVVIFNRLYGAHDRGQADEFGEILDKEFTQVERLYPVANIMFVCRE